MSTTDLEPVQGEIVRRTPLRPPSPELAKQAMLDYQETCAAVLKPDDWIGSPGEPDSFVKRSGWIKLANFYGASFEVTWPDLERDDKGELVRAVAHARAVSADGRAVEATGACGRNEPRFVSARGRQKIEHDLPATAETRAVNRAISNLIGFGAVSAEEVDADVRAGGSPLPAWAKGIDDDAGELVDGYLDKILVAYGHELDDVARLSDEIVANIGRHCDGQFPAACARLAGLLAQVVPDAADNQNPDS